MLVRDVLRRKGSFVAVIAPDATVTELLALLDEHNVGALVASADGETVDGIVSERDVARALHASGPAVLHGPVAAIMTADVAVTAPEESVEHLMQLMTEHRVRHLPVCEGERLVGIVSIGDLVKSRIDTLESERESLIGYISSGG